MQAAIEHARWGDFVFTVGLAGYFRRRGDPLNPGNGPCPDASSRRLEKVGVHDIAGLPGGGYG